MSATDANADPTTDVADSGAVTVYGSTFDKLVSLCVAEGKEVTGPPECALVRLTPAEARNIAATLTAAADRIDPYSEAVRLAHDSGGAL